MHSGDFSGRGRPEEILSFLNWLEMQKYGDKVLIPGNHDFGMETDFAYWKAECEKKNIHLLNDSGITIQGVPIWGSPITPWFHSWAFNRWRGKDIKKHWDLIPENTEILITHGPPKDILDMCVFPDGTDREGVGCDDLLTKILQIPAIKLHVFGHIHEARGHTYKHGKTFVNASSLDQRYYPVKDAPVRILKDSEGGYVVEEQS